MAGRRPIRRATPSRRRASTAAASPPRTPRRTRTTTSSRSPDSGIAYRPGDALGVWPRNPEALVDAILARIGATGSEPVATARAGQVPLREALAAHWDLALPSRRLLEALLALGAERFRPLLAKGSEALLTQYLRAWDAAHDVLDVLNDAPEVRPSAPALAEAMRALQPRLYSIASSERAHPGEAHLLVLTLRYQSLGRTRLGVGSGFINERWPLGQPAPVYVQDAQKHFAMPADPSTPMIMIGPGTGLAPFRGFLEERRAAGASGRNWLFFGEQSRAWGFYYEQELTEWQRPWPGPARPRVLARSTAQDLRPASDARTRAASSTRGWRRARRSSSAATRNAWRPTSSANSTRSSKRKAAALRHRRWNTSRR